VLFNRIGIFTNLRLESLDRLALKKQVAEIGKSRDEQAPQCAPEGRTGRAGVGSDVPLHRTRSGAVSSSVDRHCDRRGRSAA